MKMKKQPANTTELWNISQIETIKIGRTSSVYDARNGMNQQ